MKTGALIMCAAFATVGLTAFTYQTSEIEPEVKSSEARTSNLEKVLIDDEPELTFFYNYGPRFSEITKAKIEKAVSITDLYKKDQIEDIVSYGKVKLILINDGGQSDIQEFSEGTLLTEAQLKLLKSLDYSASFNLRADCTRYNAETDEVEDSFHSPHLTIVPEKQAVYLDGRSAFIQYLSDGSSEEKALVKGNKMRPARLFFTVTKKGKISNVRIGNHSGYASFDKKMIDLIKKLPGTWEAAENGDGEKIDQELVVAWGFDGC